MIYELTSCRLVGRNLCRAVCLAASAYARLAFSIFWEGEALVIFLLKPHINDVCLPQLKLLLSPEPVVLLVPGYRVSRCLGTTGCPPQLQVEHKISVFQTEKVLSKDAMDNIYQQRNMTVLPLFRDYGRGSRHLHLIYFE